MPGDLVESLCPTCLGRLQGHLERGPTGEVSLRKTCPQHGEFRAVVAHGRDALTDDYETLGRLPRKLTRPVLLGAPAHLGCPEDCGLCPAHDQHTCLAVIDVTSRCSLSCPVCLACADGSGGDLALSVVEAALRRVIESEGSAPALQISGGEPSLHPQIAAIIRLARALGFQRIELNTNGQLLGESDCFASELKGAGLSGVYLQFDSLHQESTERLRGRDVLPKKLGAIERCRSAGLSVVLSTTVVPGVNDDELWSLVEFAASQRLTGINFQAMAHSGRVPSEWDGRPDRFTLWHFRSEIERQSGGRLLASDVVPMSCSDPRCGALSYLLVRGGEILPFGRLLREDQLRDLVAGFGDWGKALSMLRTGDASCSAPADGQCGHGCGCADQSQSASDLDPVQLVRGSTFFSVGFHGIMDAYTVDLERARRCCVHQVTPEGALVPLCLYNMKYRAQPRTEAWGSHEARQT